MVEIKLNGEWIDITNQILNQIEFDKRADEVLDNGKFTFQSNDIDYNIPPLTHCLIDGQLWLCSSECNKIVPSNYYNHEVELLELTYMAHTVIIGSKSFSNSGNYKTHNAKLQIIAELATSKNKLLYGNSADEYFIYSFKSEKNIEREFQFGSGTSLFQMLLEIGKTVNAIPRIRTCSAGNYDNLIYYIEWDHLDSNDVFTLDNNKILGIKYYQDVENYTEILETEMTNVVDRDTIITVNNLTVRSEEATISSDNQVLLLPSKAEKITNIEYMLPYLFEFRIFYNDESLVSGLTPDLDNNYYYWLTLKTNPNFAPVAAEFENILKNKGIPLYNELKFYHFIDNDSTTYKGYFSCILTDKTNIKPLNLNHVLLETNQFELLDISEQTKYLVYKTGTNKVDNLFKHYKGGLWNEILGITTYPVIEEYLNSLNFEQDFKYGNIQVTTKLTEEEVYEQYKNPIKHLFNVSYIPIIDTFIKSTNTKLPFNESNIKHSSRSFEASSSMVDFNLLLPSINKTNEMIGMPEITISYEGENIPNVSNLIEIKDKNYYVGSVQTTIKNGNYISYINLVTSYSKIAEVFGVASQYESTKLPLENVITRFVYCGNIYLYDMPTGMRIKFIGPDGNIKYVYKRGAYCKYNRKIFYTVAANDQYAFDTGMVENDNLKGGLFENKQYPYSNSNQEQVSYEVSLVVEANDLTLEESRDLPNLNRFTTLTTNNITTYKDAREHLIFVYEVIY